MTTNGKQSFLDLDVSKAFAGFTFPGLDVESIVASQRKNLEALTQANQLAVEGVQAIASSRSLARPRSVSRKTSSSPSTPSRRASPMPRSWRSS
jgi:hypothetical protein